MEIILNNYHKKVYADVMSKRLYTVIAALFFISVAVSAQGFELLYQERILYKGSTIAINAEENEFGELSCETNSSSNPNNGLVLKLIDVTSAEVTASLQVWTNTLNPSVMQWCMGGNCTTINGVSTHNKKFTANSIEQVQFNATNIQSEGTIEATLSITIGGVTKSVYILFTNNPKQSWWNYFNNRGTRSVYGSSKAERYNVATYVPYGYIGGENVTIDGLSLYFLDSDVSDIQYWVSTTLPEFNGQANLETVQLPMSNLQFSQYNEVKFKESHTIPLGGLYVGYSFTVSALNEKYSRHPISYRTSTTPYSSGFYFSTSSNPTWKSHSGDLMIRILSSGQFINNAVSVSTDSLVYTIKDSEQAMNVKIRNVGITPVRSVRYLVETDGEKVAEGVCQLSIPEMMSMSTISIPLPTDIDAAIYNRSITITDVNSQFNESNNNQIVTKQYNLLTKPQFMPLFEEFTATWCGWCIRGIVAMERAQEQYGDKAALIAVHSDTPMGTDDYNPVKQKFCDSYPSGVANRAERKEIVPNTIVDFIQSCNYNVTPASIEADAYWANAEETRIRIDTKTTFQLNMLGNYAIAYILTSDGLKGTGSEWNQKNSYSGTSDSDPDMQYWCSQPSYVSGVVFNRVAVAAWQPLYGVEGSVDSDIKAGVPQTYSFFADINGNTIIQDKAKLKMITLLLNADTGGFINAAQTTINAYDPAVIDEPCFTAQQIIERYRLDGQKINTPQRGINIIRMKDGTIKKVVVR